MSHRTWRISRARSSSVIPVSSQVSQHRAVVVPAFSHRKHNSRSVRASLTILAILTTGCGSHSTDKSAGTQVATTAANVSASVSLGMTRSQWDDLDGQFIVATNGVGDQDQADQAAILASRARNAAQYDVTAGACRDALAGLADAAEAYRLDLQEDSSARHALAGAYNAARRICRDG